MSRKPKSVRIIPPLTDGEMDSRQGGTDDDGRGVYIPQVSKDTLKRVDEALRWHEKRAKGQP